MWSFVLKLDQEVVSMWYHVDECNCCFEKLPFTNSCWFPMDDHLFLIAFCMQRCKYSSCVSQQKAFSLLSCSLDSSCQNEFHYSQLCISVFFPFSLPYCTKLPGRVLYLDISCSNPFMFDLEGSFGMMKQELWCHVTFGIWPVLLQIKVTNVIGL